MTQNMVEVRWNVPAMSNGVIIHFTVHAVPVGVNLPVRGKRQIDKPQMIKRVKNCSNDG